MDYMRIALEEAHKAAAEGEQRDAAPICAAARRLHAEVGRSQASNR